MKKGKDGIYCCYIKRFLDILLSLLGIIILSPIFLIVTVLIRIKLGKPVIFKQKRPGKIDSRTGEERIFTMYKFRSMKDATDKAGNKLTDAQRLELIKREGHEAVSTDEERMGKFGRILRKLSLDELPELFNILKGDMSFVGPRPLAVIYLSYYTEEEHHRHDVRPGLTGLAQVNGRNALSWEEKFAYDLEYISKVSLWEDIKILWKTVYVVIKHDNVEQNANGQKPRALSELRKEKMQ